MDNRKISEFYQSIINELIETREDLRYIKDADVTIIALASQHRKKAGDKLVLGQCEKIADKYRWGIPCEFTITVFEPNIIGMSHEQIKILLLHELYHVGIDGEKLYIKKHDLEDFKAIINAYGTDWATVDEPMEI